MKAKWFTFQRDYFIVTIVLFFVEVCIALFVNDSFIRPYAGDYLVVILIYCFARAFSKFPVFNVAFAVLLFAFFIEFLQYMRLIYLTGLENVTLARVILGSSFEWVDVVVYVLGFLTILFIELLRQGKRKLFRK